MTITSCNRLLLSLREDELDYLEPSLAHVDLPLETALDRAGEPIEFAYFMESGFACVVAGDDSKTLDTAQIGFEGMTAVSLLFGDGRSVSNTFVRGEGTAMRISAADLRYALFQCPSLERFLLRYALAYSVQVNQTLVATGRGTIGERLARWLLMAHDRFRADRFELTHNVIATMLGVRRSGVTVAIHMLEGDHLIKASRRQITVLDREGLERRADRSYGVAEREYERLVGDRTIPRTLNGGKTRHAPPSSPRPGLW
jgi:CRP-like cAMP-binding protein